MNALTLRHGRSKPRSGGFALPAVLFALLLVGIVSMVAVSSSEDEGRSDKAFRDSGLAMYAAEAGLSHTLGAWPAASVRELDPGDSTVVGSGWTTMAYNASYRTVIYRVDNNQLQEYVVIVTGRRLGGIGGEATVMSGVSGVPLWRWGVLTKQNISISGTGGIDSYNSDNGAYGGANVSCDVDVAANGNISMSGGATICGDATAVGTVSSGVTGTTTAGSPLIPVPPNLPCPVGGYTAAINNGGDTHISYTPATGVLNLSGGAVLTLPYPASGFYYFSSLTLSGNSIVNVNSGGQHVDIYIDNLMNTSGGGLVNTASAPGLLGIRACGSPATPAGWTLTGGSGASYTVYAPNHDLTLSGGGQISGAVIAKSLTNSGGAAIHFDKALLNSASTTLTAVPGSWTQLSAF